MLPDQASDLVDPRHGLVMRHPDVNAVVVPLVPDRPHEDRRVVLGRVHLPDDAVWVVLTIAVDRGDHPDASLLQCVQHLPIPGHVEVVRAHCVDAGLHHEVLVQMQVVVVVRVVAVPPVHRTPADALHVQWLAVDHNLATADSHTRALPGMRGVLVPRHGLLEAVVLDELQQHVVALVAFGHTGGVPSIARGLAGAGGEGDCKGLPCRQRGGHAHRPAGHHLQLVLD
mmetsp:Transcript_47754/g.123267  ORF Transcript_47754/g.123267 Transcript_47754/m.123267 type:complete len:227 (-) Transcript_47754:88-768(-)